MKKTIKVFAIALASIACANGASGQSVSANANATCTIITPLAITHGADLLFGNIAVLSSGGTVKMDTSGVRSVTGDVSLPSITGTFNAAYFNVTGATGDTYSITLPSGTATLSDGSAHTMSLGSWMSSPTTTGTIAAGTNRLEVGATLTVNGS